MHKLLITLLFLSVSLAAEESREYHIFSGQTHKALAQAVAKELGAELEQAKVKCLKEGSRAVAVEEKVNNKNVFLVQPITSSEGASINDNLMELFMLVRELKRSSCRKLTLVIPFFGYAKDARTLNVEDVAALLESADVDRVVCLDLPCSDLQACFQKASVEHLSAASLFAPYFAQKRLLDPVIVACKEGNIGQLFQKKMGECGVEANLAKIVSKKGKALKVESVDFAGGFEQRDVILVDDVCESADFLLKAAECLQKMGAREIYACVTHPALELEVLKAAPFQEVVLADTLPLKGALPSNVTQLSIAPLLAEAIYRIETNRSLKEI